MLGKDTFYMENGQSVVHFSGIIEIPIDQNLSSSLFLVQNRGNEYEIIFLLEGCSL